MKPVILRPRFPSGPKDLNSKFFSARSVEILCSANNALLRITLFPNGDTSEKLLFLRKAG